MGINMCCQIKITPHTDLRILEEEEAKHGQWPPSRDFMQVERVKLP
jgi:hypothetical protein